MRKKCDAGASASATLRQHGQRSLLSAPLFSSNTRAVRKPVSLSEFLDRKLGKSKEGDGGLALTKEGEKKTCFPSIGFGSGMSNGPCDRIGGEGSREPRGLDESVFRKLNYPAKQEGSVVVVDDVSEEETAGFELLETCDAERDSKKREPPFGNWQRLSGPKYLVVLGDDPKPRHKRRKNTVNKKQMPLYNHYASGSGWWDCDREGVDSEEVGYNETWEGMGFTTLGGLEWH